MPSAEIITIGTELLLGDITDTNSQFIARSLRDIGLDLFRILTVGDNVNRIATALRESLNRCDLIITTGGLGPTVDDPTREAIAKAVGVETEYHAELWEQIQARFRRYNRRPSENNKRQAYLPAGAIAVENPVGTAPAFIVERGEQAIISLPGVPSEMKYLMNSHVLSYIRQHFNLKGVIKSRIIHTAGLGESQIDHLIGDLETYKNPTVGLAAHSGQVDIRITAKAESPEQANNLISPVEAQIQKSLRKWIYGADQETLEEVAVQHLKDKGWTFVALEANLGGLLIGRLSSQAPVFLGGELLPFPVSMEKLLKQTEEFKTGYHSDVGLGISIQIGEEKHEALIVLITPEGVNQTARPYGGPREYAPRWAYHHGLDLLRSI